MANARKHLRALLHLPLQLVAHGEEGQRGAAHLCRARGVDGHITALAVGFGGLGEAVDRAGLIAQKQDGNDHQNERRKYH